MQQPSIMDIEMLNQASEMLTPGSVWVRKNGSESRYLFTTNTTVPAEHAHKYPQMAIFADDEDQLFSVPVEDFIGKRQFFNIDPALEERLGNLLAMSDTGSEDFSLTDDDETLLVVSGEDTEADADVFEANDEETYEDINGGITNVFPVEFFAEGTGLPEVISPQRLAELTESYQQQPLLSENKLMHTLFIKATDDVTRATLYASFSPTHAEKNAVYTFKVRTPEGLLDIDWDALVGIYPYVFQDTAMFQVMFSSSADLQYDKVDDTVDVMLQPTVALEEIKAAFQDRTAQGSIVQDTMQIVQQVQGGGAPQPVVQQPIQFTVE